MWPFLDMWGSLSAASGDTAAERFDRSEVTLAKIKAIAQRMFHPYKFDFKICEWWSAYQVGQRVAERSQDTTGRVLLAGDAVHTHSLKVGLGTNTSIQDGWNMGWKLAMAIANGTSEAGKKAPSAILTSYDAERHPVAQMLIDYDRTLSNAQEIRGQNPDDFIHYRRHPKSLIELITISHSTRSADQVEIHFEDLPEAMRGQFDAECFGWDYETAFVDAKLHAVAAPDMHVGWVGTIENVKGLEGYFESLSKSF
ncbi:unnamed protein product [Fusarium langsethiae]|nr:unnamed protein product [Fusarium langsethiae]